MAIELADDDLQLMVSEIQRFCQRSIGPLVERPARAIEPQELDRLTDEATAIGLLNFEAEPGAGLWENLDSSWGTQLSSTALQSVAQACTGVAYHFHQLAMGNYLRRCLGLSCGEQTIVCVQGTYGLARHSLARLLKGESLEDGDLRMLSDYFVRLDSERENMPLMFQAAGSWQHLLVPCLREEANLVWALFPREALTIDISPHSHGLDETSTWLWHPGQETPQEVITDRELCLRQYRDALGINAQALLAIGLGAVRQGYHKAVEYAAVRVQGGKPIKQHVAVQQMLADCRSTIQTVELLLKSLAELALTADNLGKVFNVRAQAHNLLCDAANHVLQVFGGSGYVRETGVEKIVRDNNHLRLLCGSPSELLLFLSEWESPR
jgi:hypothetical protein